MSYSIAAHLQIVKLELTDEYVEKRSKAITALCAWLGKRPARELVSLASAITSMIEGEPIPDQLSAVVAKEITAVSPAFVASEETSLEQRVCLILAAVEAVRAQKPDGKRANLFGIFSSATVLGLDVAKQPNDGKLGALFNDLRVQCEDFQSQHAEIARQRLPVPPGAAGKTDEQTWEVHFPIYKRAADEQTRCLKHNSELDREEIDLLWSALVDRSQYLEGKRSSYAPATIAVLSAMDISRLLVRPCARAHLDLACIHLPKECNQFSLTAFADINESLRAQIKLDFEQGLETIIANPKIFQVMWTILNSEAGSDPKVFERAGLGGDVNQSLVAWTRRALRELSIARTLAALPKSA